MIVAMEITCHDIVVDTDMNMGLWSKIGTVGVFMCNPYLYLPLIGSVWFLLGLQYHWISGGTALQCNRETGLSLGTESHRLLWCAM
jgi:hypothetical protein